MALSLNLGNIVVHLRANTLQFQKQIKTAEAVMLGASKNIGAAALKMSLAVTAPLALIAAASVKQFSKFEDAVVEIQKVTDKATADTLADSMERLSQRIPLAADELALLAADAARFGIQGVDNIEKFTEVVAKMAIATDLSTEKAGESLAKLTKLAGVPIDQVENLGSAINTLSNTFETSATDIVDSMLRSVTSMKQFGLNAKQMVGFTAVMNAAGFSAERSGTQIAALITALSTPQTVTKLTKVLGLTVDQFLAMTKTAPIETILKIAEAMTKNQKAAFALGKTMDRNTFKAFLKIGNQAERVRKAIDLSNKSFSEGTSLQIEFEAAAKTFTAQTTLMWSAVKRLGRGIGKVLVPLLLKLNKIIVDAVTRWDRLSDGTKTFIVQLGIFLALIGPVLFILAKIIALGAFLLGLVGSFAGAIAFIVGFGAAVLAFMASPLGIVIGLLGILAAVILKNTTLGDKALEALKGTFQSLGNVIFDLLERTKMTFGAIVSAISNGDIPSAVKVLWAQINLEWAKGINAIAQPFGDFIDTTVKLFDFLANEIIENMRFAFDFILLEIETIIEKLLFVADLAAQASTLGLSREETNKIFTNLQILKDASKSVSGFKTGVSGALQTNIDERNQASAARIPIADRAAQQLKDATAAWVDAVGTIAKAEEDNRKKLAAPVFAGAEKGFLERERKRLERLNLQNQGTDEIGLSAGSFFASQLQAFGSADVQDEKKTQLDQLFTQKQIKIAIEKSNALLEENAGVITVG